MAIKDRIRSVRMNKGLKQSDLAIKAGVSRVSIGNYERGDRIPPADVAVRLAKALDVPVNYLLLGTLEEISDDERLERAMAELEEAGFTVYQDENDHFRAIWRIDNEEAGISTTATEDQIMRIVDHVLADAQNHKEAYIKKRLIAEFE